MNQIMQSLSTLFGSLALLLFVIGGFVLMFSPSRGKKILTNTGIAVAIFVGASMLLSLLAAAAKEAVKQGNISALVTMAALGAVGVAMVSVAFLYVFRPRSAGDLLKRALVAAVAVLVFAFGARAFFGQLNSFGVLMILGVASIIAFIIRERRRPRPPRRSSGALERKPLVPHRENRA